jgi:hypothetical protein
MKIFLLPTLLATLTGAVFVGCSKPIKEKIAKPMLLITLRNDTGKSVPGALVRLYKNVTDTGITKISDSTGVVLFSELDPELYYWFAKKDCATNRVSQVSLDRPLLPGVVLYGYSVMVETGTLKIINNSPEAYNVSDSFFKVTVKKDTPFIIHQRVRSYLVHSERVNTPGIGKDTLIRIKCGDTSILNLPY